MDAESKEIPAALQAPAPAPLPAAAPGERGAKAQALLATLLGHLGVTAEIEPIEAGEAITLKLKISGGAEAVGLADPRAPLWEPIAYLVGKMMTRDPSRRCSVALDTGAQTPIGAPVAAAPGAPAAPMVEENDEELLKMGRFLAERAKQVGKVLVVGPMGSRERKAIHVAVKEVGGVTSRSEGEGAARRLLIVPDKLAAPPTQPDGA
jgi:spoIIIJ-associated protein